MSDVIAVLGADSPHGRAVVRALAAGPATLVLGAAVPEELAELVQNGRGVVVQHDPHDRNGVPAVIDKATELGRLIAVIAPAPAPWTARLLERDGTVGDPDALLGPLRSALEVSVAVLGVAGAAMQSRSRDNRGVVVLPTAARAVDGQAGNLGFGAATSALVGMVLPAARELARASVRVCGVAFEPRDRDELALNRYAETVRRTIEDNELNGETVHVAAELGSATGPAGAPDVRTYPVWTRVAEGADRRGFRALSERLRRLLLLPKLPASVYRDAALDLGMNDYDTLIEKGGQLPDVYASDDWLSTKTATQVYWSGLVGTGPDGLGGRVVEIGGGVGNLARLAVSIYGAQRYALVDIEPVLEIQRGFLCQVLDPAQLERVSFHEVAELIEAGGIESDFDLGLSTFALTETPPDMRAWYAQNVFARCRRLLVIGQRTFQSQDVLRQLEPLVAELFDYHVEPYLEETVLGRPTFLLSGVRR